MTGPRLPIETPAGQDAELRQPRRRRNPEGGPIVTSLGEVQVGAESASVHWTQQGDAVGIDFTRDGYRYACVFDLDTSEPRMVVEPGYEWLIEKGPRDALVKAVVDLWASDAGRS